MRATAKSRRTQSLEGRLRDFAPAPFLRGDSPDRPAFSEVLAIREVVPRQGDRRQVGVV